MSRPFYNHNIEVVVKMRTKSTKNGWNILKLKIPVVIGFDDICQCGLFDI